MTTPGTRDRRRPRRYVWVTWLTKLLAGEDRCWWKSWYKVHYKYEKLPEDGDREEFFREYTARHDALVNRRAEELRAEGYVTRGEDDAAFKLVGERGDLGGKPDLVAIRDGKALVVEGKSGKARKSDHWQVLVYLFALPMTWLKVPARGEVLYRDGSVPVRPLGTEEQDAIVGALRRLTGSEEPDRVPSRWECKRCDIASCPDRVEEAPEGDARRFF